MKSNLTKLALAGVVTLSAMAAAMASPVDEPGATVGLDVAVPLPPGFYFVNNSNWGVRDVPGTAGGKQAVGVNIPALTWSTPWKVLGAQFMVTGILPSAEVGISELGIYHESLANPILQGTLAWHLGGGISASYTLGANFGMNSTNSPMADASTSVFNAVAISYHGGDWHLIANLQLTNETDKTIGAHPDTFQTDLTAIRGFGKWQVGAVAFYSTDIDRLAPADVKQSQFAIGALLGYDWGPLTTQVYITRDVWQEGYNGLDTRIWGRIIVPLGNPMSSASSMYHK